MELSASFKNQMTALLKDDAESFFVALDRPSPTSIRLNASKRVDASLLPAPVKAPVPWCTNAYYLENRPVFTLDPLFHAGCYYVQEASSMFLQTVVKQALCRLDNPGEPIKALDLCAAPGGKTTLLMDSLPADSLLVANEIDHHRANILAENIIKWGSSSVVVTQAEAADFAKARLSFDLILTDVPCSGEGMFRKEPDAIADWSLENVKMCAERQRSILQDIWPTLRAGGCLIYSTCTYNRQEDEDNVQWIAQTLGADILAISASDQALFMKQNGVKPSYQEGLPAYHFFPHQVMGEGFFIALLQKHGTTSISGNKTSTYSDKKALKRTSQTDKKTPEQINLSSWIDNAEDYSIIQSRPGFYRAFPKKYISTLLTLKEKMRIIHAGIGLGEEKGKDFLPDISLALSTHLRRDSYPCCELNIEQALSYLRRESFALPEHTPKGLVLVTYHEYPLGWMKNLGSRANNMYPNEWRIRLLKK